MDVESGRLRISDPCYSPDSTGALVLVPVLNGNWRSLVVYEKSRVKEILVIHEDYSNIDNWTFGGSISVDSGQAGIYDDVEYIKIHSGDQFDEFYDLVCEQTCGPSQAGEIEQGVTTSSGYGDGEYDVFYSSKNGRIVAVKIPFIQDSEDGS